MTGLWHFLCSYSPTEHGKQIFTMKNLMRCKLVPDDSKMVMTSSVGTMMILHDLDLLTLDLDLQSYISFDEAFQLAEFRKILTRPKNRLEIINEFPSEPDIVASLQVDSSFGCLPIILCIVIYYVLLSYTWLTGTTVWNPVISTNVRLARFTSPLWQFHDLHEVWLTQKRGFDGAKVFYMEHALAYPNHTFRTCGGPETFTSAIILNNVVWK